MTGDLPRARIGRGSWRTVVPAGMAVLTWLVLLVVVGVLAQLRTVSFSTVLHLGIVVGLLWPLVAFVPWRPGVTSRVWSWGRRSRGRLLLVALLLLLSLALTVAGAPDPLVTVLRLPSAMLSGRLYGMSLLYRQEVGVELARAVHLFAEWYVRALWAYLLAGVVIGIAHTGRRRR